MVYSSQFVVLFNVYFLGGINHIGHVGGAVFGIVYWMMKIRRGGRGSRVGRTVLF